MRLARRPLLRGLAVLSWSGVCAIAFTVGCFGRSELDAEDPFVSPRGNSGEGGTGAVGGAPAGGRRASGGATSRAGSPGAGGFVNPDGGVIGTGATAASGGFVGAGGFVEAGGVSFGGFGQAGTGGLLGSGGFFGAGGVAASGGRFATGGSGGVGGVHTGGVPSGGAGGVVASGGAAGAGGAPACGPSTCPGCCTSGGLCVPGNGTNACGSEGARCADCGSSGFACDQGICQGVAPACAGTCEGCCDSLGRCRLGSETDACGVGGGACTICSSNGAACTLGKCGGKVSTCDATTCGGCCDAKGVCQPGTANTACGAAGVACDDCGPQGRTCSEPGSYCAFIPSCSSATCPTGCCDASGVCQDGRTDGACGTTGQKCSDCKSAGAACAPSGFCYNGPHCGPDTCAGCCSADGTCRPGTGAQMCGAFGAVCENCTSQGQTCQGGACGARGATCPVPYAGCNPGSATSPPTNGTSCASVDLDLAQKACTGETTPSSCLSALSQLLSSNPGCFDCLQQFLYDGALAKCLAPFLNPTCNHALTCYEGCLDTTCGRCSDADLTSCQGTVSASGGDCFPDLSGEYCAAAAFSGPAAFCNLGQIKDVGLWLRGVGAYYCSG